MSGLIPSTGTSDDAKAATRRMLDTEIAYFNNSIQTHLKAIERYQRMESWLVIGPLIRKHIETMISEEQANIDVATRAIQRYKDLEAYYTSQGWL